MGEFLVTETLGEAGRTGACLPLQQCSLDGEGSPWLLRLLFRVSPWELELASVAEGGVKALGPCAFVLGRSRQSFG